MLPCKKRRATVTESVQQGDDQEGDDLDLESAVKPESDQLKDLGSESLSWGPGHESAVCPELHSMHDVENQLSMEDPSLSSKMLTQHGNLPVLEAVGVAIPQDITLPSLESSHSLTVHIDQGRLLAAGSKKVKKTAFQPGLMTREDQGDPPVIVEPPSGEPGEEVKAEGGTKRKRDGKGQEQGTVAHDLKLDDVLDRTLEDGAKQYNLTAINVRNILHEVITNEHVVAMMKAAISETEDMPLFEPKMTRSKLKEVVEKGVVIPTWNISPIKKANEIKQPPQFVDIHLEEDDSSDEEYQPDEEEEDETAEESLLESDVESTASSPRGVKRSRLRASSEVAETDEESGMLSEVEKVTTPAVRHISAEVVPMGPPPPPKPKQTRDSAFMEKLNAVDEELASSPVCMDSFQPMEDSLIAFRTRSKMPLKDVPLGQLEAELQAPDITPDMYDPNTADDEDWKVWLGGLLNDDVENEDEGDDDDDPEYNFLEDLDEPDTEDFRTDRAVRITKKEVNGLMEELFETFQDEMGFSNMEEDGPEEEERVPESRPDFNTPQTLRFEEPLANLLNERHRTVKELLEQLKMKKSSSKPQPEVERLKPQKETVHQALILDTAQRSRLQQQMQQHVQLLTQIHLLTTSNPNLSSEASTTRVFLKELGTFAENSIALHQQFNPKFQTLFQPCNWMGAMQLIEDFAHVSVDCIPHKTVKKTASEFPCLPKQVAWILATNKVFMYPELLPICSLKANNPRDKIIFTKAEDNLLALGLKHFEGTEFPKPLISKYLVTCKTAHQLTVRIKNLNQNRAPNNVIKFYKKTKQLPVLMRCCEETQPQQWKPPVEKEEHRLPFWLKASVQSIQDELRKTAEGVEEGATVPRATEAGTDQHLEKACPELGSETRYPLLMPKGVVLKLKPDSKRFIRKALRLNRPLVQKPLLIQPSPCVQPGFNPGKIATWSTQSEVLPGNIVVQIPHLIQPATVLQPLPGFSSVAVSGEHSFESSAALPTMPSGPEARTSFPLSESQSPLPSSSAPKIMLPSLAPSKFRKPYVRRKPTRRKGTKVSPCVKAAPIIHPTPVIFTVPAATVKVVSLPSGCNVIQPVNAAVAPNPQTIPITTLLVNPTSFPCPLNQPLVASSISPLIVSSNPLTLPVPSVPEDKVQVNLDIAEEKNAPQNPDSTSNSQELTPLCATVFSKEDPRPWCSSSGMESQETSSESSACGWAIVKTENQEASSESSACGWTGVKMESQEGSSESSACAWTGVKIESQEGSSESSACGWTGVKMESQEGSSESSACGWTGVKMESQEGSSESSACGWTGVKMESQEGSSESSACAWTGVKMESQEGSSESSACAWTGVKMESQEGSSESSACTWTGVKMESQEGSSESSAYGWTGVKMESQEGSSESSACAWTGVKTESQEGSSESSACAWTGVKMESQEGSSESSACGWTGVKMESQEGSSESSAYGWTGVKMESQEGSSESSSYGWTGVKNEEDGQALESLPLSLQLSLNSTSKDLEEMVKMEAEDRVEEMSSTFPEQDIGEKVKEEYSMELDRGSPQEKPSSARERRREAVVQTEETRAASSLSVSQEPPEEGSPSGEASRGLPRGTPSSVEQETVLSRPPGKAEDSAIADSQSVGTPAGPDTGGEKDGPEEEEEEDFDDLTQDEEDELSSASEESVLSVPELQETMEKLTWLASERSMSQEGESEEENSQEENSEPEEEEEEEAEGMEALQKEDEVNDEAVGDAAEKPPSTSASPKTAPEVESSISPAGGTVHMLICPHMSTWCDDIIVPTPPHTHRTNTGVYNSVCALMDLHGPVTCVESSNYCVESSCIGGNTILHEL
ncbi:GON-4-like protein isoform X16 [Peromyscus maniculatus bairdii]|uniref:GON-4-like protein isoform X16 n=1 Tax=Peromyscus maniculatus bairdii TaxID=230844 RepID=UPI003FD5F3B8